MTSLSLHQAEGIVDSGLDRARELGLKPLTIAVLDAGGHLVAFKRQDKSGILRPDIAQGKAWGALGMGLGGRALAQRAEMAPAFFTSLASVSHGRIIPVPGGVLIRADEACAFFGIERVGLVADGGVAVGHIPAQKTQ
jgi:uncharacterized protein GlcG (DUF336 family)